MLHLPEALQPLANFRQFVLWKLVAIPGKDKPAKMPVDPSTLHPFVKGSDWQKHPAMWTDFSTASKISQESGGALSVGFLFTPEDPFFFVDLDDCANGTGWNHVAQDILNRLPGCAVEVSQSGTGLHIFGTGSLPEHSNKNVGLGLELYHEYRFVALTGNGAMGSAATAPATLSALVSDYFPPKVNIRSDEWTTEALAEWAGPESDDELIELALASDGSNVFGSGLSFRNLWEGDEEALATAFPDERGYDGSSADLALALRLAYWTGCNCERIKTLMFRSGLVREKWDTREDYVEVTITSAVQKQEAVLQDRPLVDAIAESMGAVAITGSKAQQYSAAIIRKNKLEECQGEVEILELLCAQPRGGWWMDNRGASVEEMAAMLRPTQDVAPPDLEDQTKTTMKSGAQVMPSTLQLEKFAGCVYVKDKHGIKVPSGEILKQDQFNVMYGGFSWILDQDSKDTRKAWDAFTESQLISFPRVDRLAFRPALEPGAIVVEEEQSFVNTYVPVKVDRKIGDPSRFLTHLAKLLPDDGDRAIMLAYMAACVQHAGVKFQWCPLVQGAEGNGKTLLTRCVAHAVGRKYTHFPKAAQIDSKFNSWLVGKLLIGVEDIYVPESKIGVMEALKPMITGGDGLEIEGKGDNQTTEDICANFMLNSNHKDAIRKTESDRRYCVFYTAQQSAADITRDGMDGAYFPELYVWLREEGYAIVTEYLSTYAIPHELNPAGGCHRAPQTTSTSEVLAVSTGGVEQEVLEAIDQGRPGFSGGYVSSVALSNLLGELRKGGAIPVNKRRALMQSIGYDWHPALKDGRSPTRIAMDNGSRPRIFCKTDHLVAQITDAAEVARHYQESQAPSTNTVAQDVFSRP